MSLKDISRKLGVAKSTASLWLRDMPLTTEQLQKYKDQAKESQFKSFKSLQNGTLVAHVSHIAALQRMEQWRQEAETFWNKYKDEALFGLGLGLYWGEGAKTTKVLGFANADPNAIRTWIKWCKKYLPEGSPLYVRVLLRDDNDVNKVEAYWKNITGLRVRVNTVPSKDVPTRKNFTGTASVYLGKGSAEWFTKVMYCIHKFK